jgi:hypothetical protein
MWLRQLLGYGRVGEVPLPQRVWHPHLSGTSDLHCVDLLLCSGPGPLDRFSVMVSRKIGRHHLFYWSVIGLFCWLAGRFDGPEEGRCGVAVLSNQRRGAVCTVLRGASH